MTRIDSASTLRTYYALAIGLIAYGAAWIVAGVVDQPLLWYAPLEHAWYFQVAAPSPVAMDWYGRVLQGLLAGGVFGGAAWMAMARKQPGGRLPWHAIIGGWAAAVMVLCIFLYAYTLARRTVYPPAPVQTSGSTGERSTR